MKRFGRAIFTCNDNTFSGNARSIARQQANLHTTMPRGDRASTRTRPETSSLRRGARAEDTRVSSVRVKCFPLTGLGLRSSCGHTCMQPVTWCTPLCIQLSRNARQSRLDDPLDKNTHSYFLGCLCVKVLFYFRGHSTSG